MTSWTDNLLLACALKKETRGLEKVLGTSLPLITTGLGSDRTVRSLEAILEQQKPSFLLFTGMAGQLDPEIGLGEIVTPAEWRLESGTAFRIRADLISYLETIGWKVSGLGLTVRVPVIKRARRLKLSQESGASICDMESAAVLMVASHYGIPSLSVKLVSDTAGSGMLAFYRNFDRNILALGEALRDLILRLDTPGTSQDNHG